MFIKTTTRDSSSLVCKSKYVKDVEVPSFKINGEVIKEVAHVKYLGHFICNTLRDDQDISRQCRQLGPICQRYAIEKLLYVLYRSGADS